MEAEPGQSGVRLCQNCGKIDNQNNFKSSSCHKCWKWFKLNIDFYHENSKICQKNCEEHGMLASCESCRLARFIKINEYRTVIRPCCNCGHKTYMNGKNPKCSLCRRRNKRACTCSSTGSQCSWCVIASMENRNRNQNHQNAASDSGKQCKVLEPPKMPDVVSSEDEELIIDISRIPKNVQKEAKTQLYLDKCWVVRLKKLELRPTEEIETTRETKKRSRDTSFSDEDYSPASVDKIQDQDQPSSPYDMEQLSETKFVFKKPTANTDSQVMDPVPGTSSGVSNNSDLQFPFPKKSNNVVKRKRISTFEPARRIEPIVSELHGAKELPNTTDETTETDACDPSVEELKRKNALLERRYAAAKRRITELQLVLEAKRSMEASSSSPLNSKSSDDDDMTLSTPLNSNKVVSAKQAEQTASTSTNGSKTKPPFVSVKRLTEKELSQHGLCSPPSSTEQQPQKKKQRRKSLTDFEKTTFKTTDNRSNGTRKVAELFGEDSDEEMIPSKPETENQKTPPYNLDALDYDYDSPKEDEDAETCSKEKLTTKTNKKEKHSGKDKKKDTKKTDDKKSNSDKKSKAKKSSREKGDKGSDKSQKEKEKEKPAISAKYRIPKRSNMSSSTVGLPPLLQDNLNQVMNSNKTIPVQQNLPALSKEPETSNEKPLVNGTNSISSKVFDVPVQQNLSALSKEPETSNEKTLVNGANSISPKVCDVNERRKKSVNFAPERELTSVRSISPRLKETSDAQNYIPTDTQNYIQTNVCSELDYVPKSSPRPPITGIRPFHPPVRKRFTYSSKSSTSSSESSDEESSYSNEDTGNVHSEETAVDAITSAHTSSSPADLSDDDSLFIHEEPMEEDTQESATSSAPPEQMSEVNLPSTALRRGTPELVETNVVNPDTAANDDSEDEDVLNIGLDVEESFGFDYEEEQLQENPPLKSHATDERNESSNLVSSLTPVSSGDHLPIRPVISINSPSSTVVANFSPHHGVSNELMNKLCFDSIRTGNCGKKCSYNHNLNPDVILNYIQYCCSSKKFKMASRVLDAMSYQESLWNKDLKTVLGARIVESIIEASFKEGHHQPSSMDIALDIMIDTRFSFTSKFVDVVINKAVPDPAIPKTEQFVKLAESLMKLFERCESEKFKISHRSLHKLLSLYVQMNNWDYAIKTIEKANEQHLEYNPTYPMIDFLFSTVFPEREKFERVCNALQKFGMHVLNFGDHWRNTVLNTMKEYGLIGLHDVYSGITSHLTVNEHPPMRPRYQLPPEPFGNHPQQMSAPHFINRPRGVRDVLPTPYPSPLDYRTRMDNPYRHVLPFTNGIRQSIPGPVPKVPCVAPIPPMPSSAPPIQPKQPLLQVPQPSQCLDVNLFGTNSGPPETYSFPQENVPRNGPSVVVEPSYQTENDLETEFKKQNFATVYRKFLQYYTRNPRCPMLKKLLSLITTCQLYKEGELLTSCDITLLILLQIDENGSPEECQALMDLVVSVLHYLSHQDKVSDDKISYKEQGQQLLIIVMDTFTHGQILKLKLPILVLFAANCLLLNWEQLNEKIMDTENKEWIVDFVKKNLSYAYAYLSEFHRLAAEMNINDVHEMIQMELDLCAISWQYIPALINEFEEGLIYEAGERMSEYHEAMQLNNTRFREIVPH